MSVVLTYPTYISPKDFGGLLNRVLQSLALNVSLKYSFGSYTDWTFEGAAFDVEDVGSTTTRFNIGLSWRPGS